MIETYYDILEVNLFASIADCKKAYRLLSLKYHPDSGSEPDEAKMKIINMAKAVLSDETKKEEYDETIKKAIADSNPPQEQRVSVFKNIINNPFVRTIVQIGRETIEENPEIPRKLLKSLEKISAEKLSEKFPKGILGNAVKPLKTWFDKELKKFFQDLRGEK